MTSSRCVIEARDLRKRYGEHDVLERLNVSVEAGEFVTLVGTSGCGKTTFLRMLLGVEPPSGGTLSFEGRPIPREPGPERGIVFQQYSVFPHMTVLGNALAAIAFRRGGPTGHLHGAAKREARHRACAMLERVALGDALERWPQALSGGMRQRLAIAQALLAEPRVLLLDEPFGALDPGVRRDMQTLVLELWAEHGLTVFMVTHDLAEGFRLGTRLWVFDRPGTADDVTRGATITYDLSLEAHDGAPRARLRRELATDAPALEPAAASGTPATNRSARTDETFRSSDASRWGDVSGPDGTTRSGTASGSGNGSGPGTASRPDRVSGRGDGEGEGALAEPVVASARRWSRR